MSLPTQESLQKTLASIQTHIPKELKQKISKTVKTVNLKAATLGRSSTRKKESKYFSSTDTTSIGELAEIKELLHSVDKSKTKEGVKRLIADMTEGKDVSSLYPDVVRLINTDKIEIKKLVYLYVINYTASQPNMAVMSINTFLKDAADRQPILRALALRTLSGIDLMEVADYVYSPLMRSLKDNDAYVRKTAVICVPKVIRTLGSNNSGDNKERITSLIDVLRVALSDHNPVIVAAAVTSLMDIDFSAWISKEMFKRLLDICTDLGEWTEASLISSLGSALVMESLCSKEEAPSFASTIVLQIIPNLRHCNPSIVCGSIRIIVKMIPYINDSDLMDKIISRLRAPFLSLLDSDSEIKYCTLRLLQLLLVYLHKKERAMGVTNSISIFRITDVKSFFCMHNDLLFVKIEKMKFLEMFCQLNNYNTQLLVTVLKELSDYCRDVDSEFGQQSIETIGEISTHGSVRPEIIEVAVSLISSVVHMPCNMNSDGMTTHTRPHLLRAASILLRKLCVRVILNKMPEESGNFPAKILSEILDSIGHLCNKSSYLESDVNSLSSFFTVLSFFVQNLKNVSSLLGKYVDRFLDFESTVQHELLNACISLFLKKPKEGETVLMRVLKIASEGESMINEKADYSQLSKGCNIKGFKIYNEDKTNNTNEMKSNKKEEPDLLFDLDEPCHIPSVTNNNNNNKSDIQKSNELIDSAFDDFFGYVPKDKTDTMKTNSTELQMRHGIEESKEFGDFETSKQDEVISTTMNIPSDIRYASLDVRERALMYWRLLSTDPEAAKKVLSTKRTQFSGDDYTEDSNCEANSLVSRFGLISSVIHRPVEDMPSFSSNTEYVSTTDDLLLDSPSNNKNRGIRTPEINSYELLDL